MNNSLFLECKYHYKCDNHLDSGIGILLYKLIFETSSKHIYYTLVTLQYTYKTKLCTH